MMGSVEPFSDGSIISANGQNKAHWRHYNQQGINTIRQLMDRAISFSAGNIEGWGEAYVNENGQLSSVDITNTTAAFDTDKYLTGILYDNFDDDSIDLTKWTLTSETGSLPITESGGGINLGTSVSCGTDVNDSARVDSNNLPDISSLSSVSITINANLTVASNNGSDGNSFIGDLEISFGGVKFIDEHFDTSNTGTPIYSGSNERWDFINNGDGTWTKYKNNVSQGTFTPTSSVLTAYTYLNTTYGGVGCGGNNISSVKIYIVTYDDGSDFVITHNVPSGTFQSNISASIGVPFIEDWEDEADIQYKLTNATEDSGWLNYGEVNTFTAFTSEPTTLIVKLVPKTTSPTTGYPSINGFYVNSWSD